MNFIAREVGRSSDSSPHFADLAIFFSIQISKASRHLQFCHVYAPLSQYQTEIRRVTFILKSSPESTFGFDFSRQAV